MKDAIPYQGGWLKAGSDAHRLHTEGRHKDLQAHMRYLDEKERCLREGLPLPPPPNLDAKKAK